MLSNLGYWVQLSVQIAVYKNRDHSCT
uniref:Uncharacterized protein n=1 Tax=Arundo donax TaxID=35708 RepID=A0A0A8ZA72_ARUDO